MKITKTRIQQIIIEEIRKIKLQEVGEIPPESEEVIDSEVEEPEAVRMTVASLRASLKKLAADSSSFRGIDAKEADAISGFINRLLTKAQQSSASSQFSRIDILLQNLKI